MKNKKTLYILIPMVLSIWGIILWQILSLRNKENSSVNRNYSPITNVQSDTSEYLLVANYSDPFLRRTKYATSVKEKVLKQNNVKNIKLNDVNSFDKPPSLIYHGFISCNNTNTGLLEYNGVRHLITEKSEIGNYKILHIKSDSMKISYNEKVYSYAKQ